MHTVLVTGGGGYVGSALVPALLDEGYKVRVIDLFLFGTDFFGSYLEHQNLTLIKGDIRDATKVEQAVAGADMVIHLACISNDPSYELDPELSKTINFDAFEPLVDSCIRNRVNRFIYASSSSVYGVKNEPEVTEDLPLEHLTDYSKYKALCEEVLQRKRTPNMTTLIVRPATICGYAPRLRLDLTVNILTNFAITNGAIKVFGGDQMRPNLHMRDMVRFYLQALKLPAASIDGKIFNVGYHNLKVMEIAELVRKEIGDHIKIEVTDTNDPRSYHISSRKVERELGFVPQFTVEDAIRDLKGAFEKGLVPNSMTDDRYYNVKILKQAAL